MTDSLNGAFLRSDGKGYVSSTIFFGCINKLSLAEHVYYLPKGMSLACSDLAGYVEALEVNLKDVRVKTHEQLDAYNYVELVMQVLRSWVEGGYGATLA